MINIIIPMAGEGKRFKDAGYVNPKPFILINGRPMIELVLENIAIEKAHYILLAKEDHLKEFPEFFNKLKLSYNLSILTVPKLTEGAAITTLAAYDLINNSTPLLIANSDQLIEIDFNDFINDAKKRILAGSILVFQDSDPKWSFVKIDEDGFFLELKEKVAISNLATAGVYYFSSGEIYLRSVVKMIINNDRTNNEFYVAPAYNYLNLISPNTTGVYQIDKTSMHGLGTPGDLDKYLGLKRDNHGKV
jgi:NDP-sugar pyrophosphorylase family protein